MQNKNITELVLLMQEGNEEAFNEVYHRFHKSLHYMAYRMTNNEADAMDAVQETFIQLQKSIHTLKEPSIFIMWMKKILFSKCKNLFRKNKEVVMGDDMLLHMNPIEQRREFLPAEDVRHQSTNDVLLHLIQNIPEIYRGPILLKYYDEQTMEEIGQILDIPTGTVKSRLRAGKGMLKAEIHKYEEQYDTKLSFHGKTLGAVLTAAYAFQTPKIPLLIKPKMPKSFSSHLLGATTATKVAIATVVTVSAVTPVAVQYVQTKKQEATQSLVSPVINTTADNDQIAYYSLKKWAHCEEDMKQKTVEEYVVAQVWYEQLKKNNGVFWKLLQKEQWTEAFLRHKK